MKKRLYRVTFSHKSLGMFHILEAYDALDAIVQATLWARKHKDQHDELHEWEAVDCRPDEGR